MLKELPILYTIFQCLLAFHATAITLVDSLQKRFKKLHYLNADATVRSTLQTHITDNADNQGDELKLLVHGTHGKLISVFRNNDWSTHDSLCIDGIDPCAINLISESLGHGNHMGNLRIQTYVYLESARFHLSLQRPRGLFYQK